MNAMAEAHFLLGDMNERFVKVSAEESGAEVAALV